jgi:hypothetical protein
VLGVNRLQRFENLGRLRMDLELKMRGKSDLRDSAIEEEFNSRPQA